MITLVISILFLSRLRENCFVVKYGEVPTPALSRDILFHGLFTSSSKYLLSMFLLQEGTPIEGVTVSTFEHGHECPLAL